MVNLTIRLSKGGPGGGAAVVGGGIVAGDGSAAIGVVGDVSVVANEPAVTVSCPDHLVLADLPVAKGLGSVSDITLVKILGRKARRRLGDKVHFCVRCDFPISIYGRLANNDWMEWKGDVLQKRNILENVCTWTCGRPNSLRDRPIDSDEDDFRERDYDMASNLSHEVFRYRMFEMDDADETLKPMERDDDEYPPVVLQRVSSPLRLPPFGTN